jgi:hypothetical protein
MKRRTATTDSVNFLIGFGLDFLLFIMKILTGTLVVLLKSVGEINAKCHIPPVCEGKEPLKRQFPSRQCCLAFT